jgi:hypothetical protein
MRETPEDIPQRVETRCSLKRLKIFSGVGGIHESPLHIIQMAQKKSLFRQYEVGASGSGVVSGKNRKFKFFPDPQSKIPPTARFRLSCRLKRA